VAALYHHPVLHVMSCCKHITELPLLQPPVVVSERVRLHPLVALTFFCRNSIAELAYNSLLPLYNRCGRVR